MVFEWSGEFLTGVKQVDDQHQALVVMINHLCNAVMKGYGHGQLRCEKAFDELAQYAVRHFDTEEKLMAEHAYPGLEEHHREHENFKQQLARFNQLSVVQSELPSIDVLNFLISWVKGHILQEDLRMGEYLRAHGVM